jgi:NCS2 family nucleobase:cation symporter-2
VLGTTCAVLLNLVMRIGVRQRETLQLDSAAERGEAAARFLTEQGARWAARRDVVERARFCLLQALEVLGDPPGGIAVEASFDEFNLDLRLHYNGLPPVLPERQPERSEILAGAEGERLLAGFLLRRNADRVQVAHRSGRSTVLFHFDH